MKKKTQSPPEAPTETDPEGIEEIVEDLGQQDVMPTHVGTGPIILNGDPETFGEQAGSWDEPVGGQAHQAGRTALEDETKSSEELVERGLTEAAEELSEIEANETPPEEAE